MSVDQSNESMQRSAHHDEAVAPKNGPFQCHWENCQIEQFDTLSNLNDHIVKQHIQPLDATNSYFCRWNGCSQVEIDQNTSVALVAHCRIHTGEAGYYCPIPECSIQFINQEEIGDHMKNVHNLIPLSESISDANLDEDLYSNIVKQTYDFKTPWWFSTRFIENLNIGIDGDVNMKKVYNLKFDLKQYKIGNYRYKKFLGDSDAVPFISAQDSNNNYRTIIKNQNELNRAHAPKKKKGAEDEEYQDDPDFIAENKKAAKAPAATTTAALTSTVVTPSIIPTSNSDPLLGELSTQALAYKSQYKPVAMDDIDSIKDKNQLKKLYEKLSLRLLTGYKINKIVTAELSKSISLKRKQWCINQMLLDANIELGLPPATDRPSRVVQDELDREILEEE